MIDMRVFIVLLVAVGLSGCKKSGGIGAKGGEAIAVATVAATMAVVQTARAQAKSARNAKRDCAIICDPCEVPCGDECLPYGAVCYSPRGRACGELTTPDVPKREPPALCPVAPGFYVETHRGSPS